MQLENYKRGMDAKGEKAAKAIMDLVQARKNDAEKAGQQCVAFEADRNAARITIQSHQQTIANLQNIKAEAEEYSTSLKNDNDALTVRNANLERYLDEVEEAFTVIQYWNYWSHGYTVPRDDDGGPTPMGIANRVAEHMQSTMECEAQLKEHHEKTLNAYKGNLEEAKAAIAAWEKAYAILDEINKANCKGWQNAKDAIVKLHEEREQIVQRLQRLLERRRTGWFNISRLWWLHVMSKMYTIITLPMVTSNTRYLRLLYRGLKLKIF